ncbi:hypothetical protein [uncultured Aeromicrobium sp.]|uniref:hypothetical protein n=1 Tax=uncultured Aeromicrobium sp. TaxID=337820 RepID=UPI0025CBB4E4|nr:hypothetical protein [uncultured Aeromicrobium sp.]
MRGAQADGRPFTWSSPFGDVQRVGQHGVILGRGTARAVAATRFRHTGGTIRVQCRALGTALPPDAPVDQGRARLRAAVVDATGADRGSSGDAFTPDTWQTIIWESSWSMPAGIYRFAIVSIPGYASASLHIAYAMLLP